MTALTLLTIIGTAGFLGAILRPDFTGKTRLGTRIRVAQIKFREWASKQPLFVKIPIAAFAIFCGLTILWWPLFMFGNSKPFTDWILGGENNSRIILVFLAGVAVAKFSARHL